MPTGSKPVAAVTSRNDKKLCARQQRQSNQGDGYLTWKTTTDKHHCQRGSPSKLRPATMAVCTFSDGSNQIQALRHKHRPTAVHARPGNAWRRWRVTRLIPFVATQNGKVIQWDARKPAAIPQPAENHDSGHQRTNRTVKAMVTYESIVSKLYCAVRWKLLYCRWQRFHHARRPSRQNVVAPSGIQSARGSDRCQQHILRDHQHQRECCFRCKDIGSKTAANGNYQRTVSSRMAPVHAHVLETTTPTPEHRYITIRRTGNISGYGKINYLTEKRPALPKWDFLETKGELRFCP